MFIPTRRATVLVPSGTAQQPNLKHLFILVTEPDGEPKVVIMVSISSVRPGAHLDPTCLLYSGDHPFVSRDSFVAYRTAQFIETDRLMRGVKKGVLIPKDPMESSIFARICQGVLDSRFTPGEIKIAYSQTVNSQP